MLKDSVRVCLQAAAVLCVLSRCQSLSFVSNKSHTAVRLRWSGCSHRSMGLRMASERISRNSRGERIIKKFQTSESSVVQAKVATTSPAFNEETEEDIYGEDVEEDRVAEARETVNTAMKTGSLIDPYERVRLQQIRKQPLSARSIFLFNAALLTFVVGSIYFIGKAYYTRQESLVRAYGEEMAENFQTASAMFQIHKRYKRRLGPGQYRSEMFSSFVVELSKRKPVTCETMIAVDKMRKKFGFKDVKLAKILSKAGEGVSRKHPGIRSKILFIADKLTPTRSESASKFINELRELLEKSYGNGGDQIVNAAQVAIMRQAVKDSARGNFDALPSGYNLLGLTESQCREILDELKEELHQSEAIAAEKSEKDQRAYDRLMEEVKSNEESPDRSSQANAYECSSCGYTLYVAPGREWKFFGDDFRCPECGAGKSSFVTKNDSKDMSEE